MPTSSGVVSLPTRAAAGGRRSAAGRPGPRRRRDPGAAPRPARGGRGLGLEDRPHLCTLAAAAGSCPAATAATPPRGGDEALHDALAECSKEKMTPCRPAATALRTICTAMVVLPEPSFPPSSTARPSAGHRRGWSRAGRTRSARPGRRGGPALERLVGDLEQVLHRLPPVGEVRPVDRSALGARAHAVHDTTRARGVPRVPENALTPRRIRRASERDADVLGLEVLVDPLDPALASEPRTASRPRTGRRGSTRCRC